MIYDMTLAPLTRRWYAAVLERVPNGARLLDVGIGTGAALAGNAATVRAKGLSVTGIDIDRDYLRRCRARMRASGLGSHVRVLEEPIEQHDGGPYDAVYFSASFMLLDDPGAALARVLELLTPTGTVLFTQTFEKRRSLFVERLKPRLAALTTIEFGRVTYAEEFRDLLAEQGLSPIHESVLHNGRARRFVLVEAIRPAVHPPPGLAQDLTGLR